MSMNRIIAIVAAGMLTLSGVDAVYAQRNGGGNRGGGAPSAAPRGGNNGGGQQGGSSMRAGSNGGGGHRGDNRGGAAPQQNRGGRPGGSPMNAGPRGGNNGPRMGAAPRSGQGGPAMRAGNPGGPRRDAAPRGGAPMRAGNPGGPRMAAPRGGAPMRAGGPRYGAPAPGPRHFAPAPRHHGHPIYHPSLGARARVFYIDNTPYYTYGGTYYRYVNGYGYEEIIMPENVIVSDLPYGTREVVVNGITYYEADGMWLQPVDDGYLIVERPVVSAAVVVPVPRPHVSFHASFGF